MNELMQALQLIYAAARQAPLTADQHDAVKAAAEKLAQHLAPPATETPTENG